MPAGTPENRIAYAAMVETLDHLVGRVLDEIDALHLTQNTLLVFLSDNGGHPDHTSNAPLRGSKWNLYEGGIREPFIVRWPGHVPAGTTSDTVVHGCDLLPTFGEIAGASPNVDALDGVSLLPVFKDPHATLKRTRPLLWHFPYYHPEKGFAKAPKTIGVADFVTSQTRPQSAIRVDDWKLLRFDEDNRVELYDLKTDLPEQHNLAASQPEVADRLHALLKAELKNRGARLARPRP
ncbi:MAG: sulfatase-like hydrolase/transferase [Prosthecobacter sp.]|nr:sulfatase-like hydrolase/transferase [Prosthecobacter sp.]